MNRDLTLGGKHTIQCTDDVLWNCALEILLTNVTPINSIKRKKIILLIALLRIYPNEIKSYVTFKQLCHTHTENGVSAGRDVYLPN